MFAKQLPSRAEDALAWMAANRTSTFQSMRHSQQNTFKGWGSTKNNFLIPNQNKSGSTQKVLQLSPGRRNALQEKRSASVSNELPFDRIHFPTIKRSLQRYLREKPTKQIPNRRLRTLEESCKVETNMIRQSQNIPLNALVRYRKTPINIACVNILTVALEESRRRQHATPSILRSRKHSLFSKLIRYRHKSQQ